MKYLVVYGSLRKDGYNYQRFEGQEYISDLELEGYEMYSLGAYPMIIEGKGTIKAELHQISEDSAKNVERMELSAGYKPKLLALNNKQFKGFATIYLWNNKNNNYLKIIDGDWIKCK